MKKLHRRWLNDCAIDLSTDARWRAKLLKAGEGAAFNVDATCLLDLPGSLGLAIEEYKLHYKVARVPALTAPAWLSEEGMVVFKFWATEFPMVAMFTGNNPEVV